MLNQKCRTTAQGKRIKKHKIFFSTKFMFPQINNTTTTQNFGEEWYLHLSRFDVTYVNALPNNTHTEKLESSITRQKRYQGEQVQLTCIQYAS